MARRIGCWVRLWKLAGCAVLLLGFQVFGRAQQATVPQAISITSPMDYQVFQRQSRLRGTIVLKGHVAVPADHIEVRVTGKSLLGPLPGKWKKISLNGKAGDFNTRLVGVAGGYYEIDVRAMAGKREVAQAAVPHVGVGEVFVISGQSNSTNYGEVRQTIATGMVSTFSGKAWRLANDPQPGVQDKSNKGSFIPAFGDAMFRKYGVPIGVASVGHGSTSVRQWLPKGAPVEVMPTKEWFVTRRKDGVLVSDGTLFDGMMERIGELDAEPGGHGFRAVLWHQGESDCHQPAGHEISAAVYEQMLKQVIQATRKQAGWNIPWFVAEASYHSPTDMSCPSLRAAQRALWENGVAFEGPDTDALTMQYRQQNGKGVHFNDAGLKLHGQLWAQAVEKYLDKQLR
ncbi:MAG TPA: sialate O-acetylesterase [Edaphobacter sp.]|nr:sialate O-acetylesterase [Edaphobacter sp.]